MANLIEKDEIETIDMLRLIVYLRIESQADFIITFDKIHFIYTFEIRTFTLDCLVIDRLKEILRFRSSINRFRHILHLVRAKQMNHIFRSP